MTKTKKKKVKSGRRKIDLEKDQQQYLTTLLIVLGLLILFGYLIFQKNGFNTSKRAN
ncbi:MAG: hypothetical protein HC817_03525 [Saprospiraceae bacterium]|nr:hypothetical protein [Saprospiraceae bacterium]